MAADSTHTGDAHRSAPTAPLEELPLAAWCLEGSTVTARNPLAADALGALEPGLDVIAALTALGVEPATLERFAAALAVEGATAATATLTLGQAEPQRRFRLELRGPADARRLYAFDESPLRRAEALVAQVREDAAARRRQFEALVANVPGAVFRVEVSPAPRVAYVSDEVARLVGFPASDFLGLPLERLRTFVSAEDAARVESSFWESTAGDGRLRLEIDAQGRSGEPAPLRLEAVIADDPVSGAAVVDGVVVHIGEERLRNRRLEDATRRAEEANVAKSRFLSNMSHELRTPMNAILGYSQLLARDESVSEEQKRCLSAIQTAGDHLLRIVNDVLELAKIEAGITSVDDSAFDFHRVLDEIESLFRIQAVNKALSWRIDREPSTARFVRGDGGKVRQVLMNLVSNAFKLTARGSVGLRSASHSDGRRIHFIIDVEDTGPGIPSSELERIFSPFSQTEAGMRAGGTGLGLAISRGFARRMNGDISVESAVGVGSAFRFTFSAVPATEHETRPPPPLAGQIRSLAGPPVSTLVVDDRLVNRDILVRLLEPVGFSVEVAENGEQALRALSALEEEGALPRIVLMDIVMPVMGGREATRALRERWPRERFPIAVIAVTASALEEELRELRESGLFDAVVRKPFRADELLSTMGMTAGLEYAYRTQPPPESSNRPELAARTQASAADAALTADERTALLEALELGDVKALERFAARLRERNVALGAVVARHARAYDFDALTLLADDHVLVSEDPASGDPQ